VALWPALTLIGTVVLAVSPAWTLAKPLVPVHLEEVDGFYYGNEATADGVPFRWTREYASLFVPNTARVVELSLRSPFAAITKEPTLVEIRSGDTLVNALVDDTWSHVTVALVSPEPPLLFSRINLKVNHTGRVSQLTPESRDERVVGIQVGDVSILLSAWEFVPKLAGARASP
jgi:hypothetical protein